MQGIALTEQAECGGEYSLSTLLLPMEYSQTGRGSDLMLNWAGLGRAGLCSGWVPVVQLPSCIQSSSFLTYGISLMGKNKDYISVFSLPY